MTTPSPIISPVDYVEYIRGLRPTLPESQDKYVEDEFEKVQNSLQSLAVASSANADAKVSVESGARVTADEALAFQITTLEVEFNTTAASLSASITEEMVARATADEALASIVTTLSASVTTSLSTLTALIDNEIIARATSDSATAATLSSLSATVNDNTAYNIATRVSLVDSLGAMSSNVTALTATVATNSSAIVTEQTVRAAADSALAASISSITSSFGTKNSVFYQTTPPATTGRVDGDIWYDTDDGKKPYIMVAGTWVLNTDARITANTAAIATEATTRASADSAIASNVTTVTTTVSGHTSTLSSHLTSINGLEAKAGIELNVNDHVIGWKLNNSSDSGEFIVQADKFAVVMPGVTAREVFGVDATGAYFNGVVRIDGSLFVNGTVVGGKLADQTVTPGKIQDGAVSDFGTYSAAAGTSLSSGSYVSVGSVTMTSKTAGESGVQVATIHAALKFTRGGGSMDVVNVKCLKTGSTQVGAIQGIDIPAERVSHGFIFNDTSPAANTTITYTVYVQNTTGTPSMTSVEISGLMMSK